MTQEEAVEAMKEGLEFMCSQARLIAMLPLEDWQAAFDKAETIGPILDPTLYREYIYSGKGEVIKKIIAAALVLKRAVMEAQPEVARHRE